MRGNDRIVVIALPLVALCLAFWFLLISPKRNEASDLQAQIDSTNASIQAAQQEVAAADAARKQFPTTYGRLVELGRAVPEDNDQSTLVYDMSKIGKENDLDFLSFQVQPGAGTTSVPSPPPTPTTDAGAAKVDQQQAASVDSTTPSGSSSTTPTSSSATSAPATEAAAATLPLGAAVGPAGLPVLPYQFKYTGNFFKVADFLGDVDSSVSTKSGEPVVHGRLMTVDGFALSGDPVSASGGVQATFAVTTYIVPPGQGITAGATPAGPAPLASGSPSTVSTATPSATPTPTAATTAP